MTQDTQDKITLYRYRPLIWDALEQVDRIIGEIENKSIYLFPKDKLNDPLETVNRFYIDDSCENAIEFLARVYKTILNQLFFNYDQSDVNKLKLFLKNHEKHQRITLNIGQIISFVFIPYLESCNNPLIIKWMRDNPDTWKSTLCLLVNKSLRTSPTPIACFSQDGNHPLMWSHYASEAGGICIEYEFTIDINNAIFPTYNNYFIAKKNNPEEYIVLCKIHYVSEFRQENVSHFFNLKDHTSRKGNDKTYQTIMLHNQKLLEWSYEKEYRIVGNLSNGHEIKLCDYVTDIEIKKVIAGPKIRESYFNRATKNNKYSQDRFEKLHKLTTHIVSLDSSNQYFIEENYRNSS